MLDQYVYVHMYIYNYIGRYTYKQRASSIINSLHHRERVEGPAFENHKCSNRLRLDVRLSGYASGVGHDWVAVKKLKLPYDGYVIDNGVA